MHVLRHGTEDNLVIDFMDGFSDADLLGNKITSIQSLPYQQIKSLIVNIFSKCDCDKVVGKDAFEGLSDVDGVRLVWRSCNCLVPFIEVELNLAFEYFHHDFELIFVEGVSTSLAFGFPNSISFAEEE